MSSKTSSSQSRAAEAASKNRLHMDRNPRTSSITDPSNPVGRRREIDNVMKRARQASPGSWDRELLEVEERDPNRWRHSGYKQLYLDNSPPSHGRAGNVSYSPTYKVASDVRRRRSSSRDNVVTLPTSPFRQCSSPVNRSRSPRTLRSPRRSRSPVGWRRSPVRARTPVRRSPVRSRSRTPNRPKTPYAGRKHSPVRRRTPRRSPKRAAAHISASRRSPIASGRGRKTPPLAVGRLLPHSSHGEGGFGRPPSARVEPQPRPGPSRARPPSPPAPPPDRHSSPSGSSASSCSDESCSVCSKKSNPRVEKTRPPPTRLPPPKKPARIPRLTKPLNSGNAAAKPSSLPLQPRERSRTAAQAAAKAQQKTSRVRQTRRIKREGEGRDRVSSTVIAAALAADDDDGESTASSDHPPQRLTLSERFGKMAAWSADLRARDNMRITRREAGLHVRIERAGEEAGEPPETYELEAAPVGCYPKELLAVAPLDMPSWDDVRVRYDYYKKRGYLRGLTLSDYVKWEEWWYKYQEWLKRERAYERWSQDAGGAGGRRERRRRGGRHRRS